MVTVKKGQSQTQMHCQVNVSVLLFVNTAAIKSMHFICTINKDKLVFFCNSLKCRPLEPLFAFYWFLNISIFSNDEKSFIYTEQLRVVKTRIQEHVRPVNNYKSSKIAQRANEQNHNMDF